MSALGGGTFRFWVVGESVGLIGAVHDPDEAEDLALRAAVHTAHTVYVHDRMEEPGYFPPLTETERAYLANLQRQAP